MDKKLPETSNLCVKITNRQRQVKKSSGTNSPLPFDVNVMLNLANRFDRGRISSVGRALDCRAGGRGFDSRGRTNTQGLKTTEK